MLKDIIKKIDSAIPNLFPVNREQFNDPVAFQTEWKGVLTGKSSGASSVLVLQDENLLAYKPSIAGFMMGIIFILIGAFVIGLYFFMPGNPPWFILPLGALFSGVGVIIFIQASSPIAFDKSIGRFYKGRKQQKTFDPTDVKHTASFSDLHAIQLLTRLESTSNNDGPTHFYRVYEMNLIKHDGQRLHVMTYGKDNKARYDAGVIGEFVGIPVWDGIDG